LEPGFVFLGGLGELCPKVTRGGQETQRNYRGLKRKNPEEKKGGGNGSLVRKGSCWGATTQRNGGEGPRGHKLGRGKRNQSQTPNALNHRRESQLGVLFKPGRKGKDRRMNMTDKFGKQTTPQKNNQTTAQTQAKCAIVGKGQSRVT